MTGVTKLALALVRPQPLPLALPARSVRVVAAAAAGAALAALAYAGLAGTTLFAVEEIEVSGASPDVARDVRATLAPFAGTSLARLDEDEVVARVKALPSVRAVEYDRAFPSTLRLVVRAEHPVAVVRLGEDAWLVSDRGRVIRAVETGTLGGVPRIWSQPVGRVEAGETITDANVRLALRALAALPSPFPARVVSARADEGVPLVVLSGGGEVRLGSAESVSLKLAVAARVLEALPADDRGRLAYLDVSVPDRAVVATNSQVGS
jgi:cell division protein FtsQ